MKHLSAAWWKRAAAAADLVEESDLREALRARLVELGTREALARELGVTPFALSGILRGCWPVPDWIAEQLGYRRVTRFEKIS